MLKFGTSACDIVRLWSYGLYVSIEIIENYYLAPPPPLLEKKFVYLKVNLAFQLVYHLSIQILIGNIIQTEHYSRLKTPIGRRQSVGYFFFFVDLNS